MAVNAELLRMASAAAAITGSALTTEQVESFDKYLNLLQKWQRSQRLIGDSDTAWIVDNLFIDSLLFLKVLPLDFSSLADIGSGAGIPGIPIKLARPRTAVTLIESRAKRVSFLSAVIRELRLEAVRVVHSRVETFAETAASSFDVAVMRCAGDFAEILPAAARLVVPGGLVAASGPPDRPPLPAGDWRGVERPGGGRRLFAVNIVAG